MMACRYPGNSIVTAAFHQTGIFTGTENVNTGDKRPLFHGGLTTAVNSYQFIFFDDKFHRVTQCNTGVNVFLNDAVITKRRVVEQQSVELFQQVVSKAYQTTTGDGCGCVSRVGDAGLVCIRVISLLTN